MIKKIKDKKFIFDGDLLTSLIQKQNEYNSSKSKRGGFESFRHILEDSNGFIYNTDTLNEINTIYRKTVDTTKPVKLKNSSELPLILPTYYPQISNMLSGIGNYQPMPNSYDNMIDVDELSDKVKNDFEALFYSHNNKEPNGTNRFNQDAIKLASKQLKITFSLKDLFSNKITDLLGKRTLLKGSYQSFAKDFFNHLLQPSKNYYIYDMHLFGFEEKFGFVNNELNIKEFRILVKKLSLFTDWVEYVVEKNEIPYPNIYLMGASNNKKIGYSYDQMKKWSDIFTKKVIILSENINHPSISFFAKMLKKEKIKFIFLSAEDKKKSMHSNAILNDFTMCHWDARSSLFKFDWWPSEKFKDAIDSGLAHKNDWGEEFERDNLFFEKFEPVNIINGFKINNNQDILTKSFLKDDVIYESYLKTLNRAIDRNLTIYPKKGFKGYDGK